MLTRIIHFSRLLFNNVLLLIDTEKPIESISTVLERGTKEKPKRRSLVLNVCFHLFIPLRCVDTHLFSCFYISIYSSCLMHRVYVSLQGGLDGENQLYTVHAHSPTCMSTMGKKFTRFLFLSLVEFYILFVLKIDDLQQSVVLFTNVLMVDVVDVTCIWFLIMHCFPV